MQDRLQRLRQKAHSAARATPRWLAVVVVVLSLVTAGVAAQAIEDTWTDDFENGNVDGWSSPQGEQPAINDTSVNGDYSMYVATEQLSQQQQPAMLWKDGPVLDMSEDFTVTFVVRPDHNANDDSIRIGVAGPDQDQAGANAFLIFDKPQAQTYLATATGTDIDGPDRSVPDAFDEEWVTVTLSSDADDDTLTATINPVSGTDEYQLSASGFDGVSGQFAVNPGFNDNNPRRVNLDSVTIEGQRATDPDLSLNTRQLYQPGSTHEYTVRETRNVSGQNRSYTVTDNATVESLNTSLLTVNSENNTLTATDDANVSETVLVRATYNNSTTYQEVTVAEPTVENLQIVPGIWRFFAVFDDSTMFALLIATLLSVPAARFTSAFGGLAVAEMVIVIGWVAGYIDYGFAAVSVFVAMFIGLNLAANIDYQVRR